MNHQSFNSLTIDGIIYSKQQLVSDVVPALLASDEKWRNDVGSFIGLWLNEELALEVFTSGSTGTPKTIRILKSAMILSAQKSIRFFGAEPGTRALMCLPANFIAGRMMLVRAFVGRWNLSLHSPSALSLKPGECFDFAAMVPLQVEKLMNSGFDFNRTGTLIMGGAACSPSVAEALSEYNAWETYGMTETVSHIALRRVSEEWFVPLDRVNLSTDGRGCLMIDAPGITQGILTTNDVVELMSNGRFRLLGRADNVVNSGGIKLFPELIERKAGAELKSQVVVMSLPDSHLGQRLVMVVESAPQAEAVLREKLSKVLDKYELPKQIFFMPTLPLTETGKIDRPALKIILFG